MSIDRVRPGDPLSAARESDLADQLEAASRPTASMRAEYGSGSPTFDGGPPTLVGLFELVGYVNYPVTGGAHDHYDRDPTPYARARRVYCHKFRSADTFPGYGTVAAEPETNIYWPLCRRDDYGYGVAPPIALEGTRVMCVFNRQSGRWEVVMGPPYYIACWGMLDEQLNASYSATVSLYWGGGDSGMNIRAYDWLLPVGSHLPAYSRVKVEFFPQDNLWWVTACEFATVMRT